MKIEVGNFSKIYHLKRIEKEDIPAVLQLCESNPLYYAHMKMSPTLENLEAVIHELPPNKTIEDKYFVGYYKENELVAILDLILGYPDMSTAFIGWFMMNEKWQGNGIGSSIMKELETEVRHHHFKKIRLGYIKANTQSAAFWKKNGFVPTGNEKTEAQYTVVILEKSLK